MGRKNMIAAVDLRADWQKLQAAKCGCRGSDEYCACQNVEEPWKYGLGGATAALPPIDWSEFEDEISDAISDSMDMDWSSRDGAKAVVRLLARLSTPTLPRKSGQP